MSNKKYGDYCCKYCGKHFYWLNGKNGHEPYCKLNPNKKQAWNKGLTKETNDKVAKISKKMKETKLKNNYVAWNKGLTKETDKRMEKISNKMKEVKSNPTWTKQYLKRIYEKYRGKHFTQTEEYKEKIRQKNLKKYGVDYLFQLPDFFKRIENKRYKRKQYAFKSGKTIEYQGYENKALDFLIQKGITEEDIIKDYSLMPPIFYFYDNKKHRYFPDIFIKSKNLFIEVKSSYTMLSNLMINKIKAKAVLNSGYNFEFWLFIKNDLFINGVIQEDYKCGKK